MATIVAQATGNWSNTATWTGGVVPGAGDTAQTGNYIVTVDVSVTCTLNPTGSGYFVVTTGGITITGNVVMQSSYSNGGLRGNHASGTLTLTGTATGGASSSAIGATNTNAGTMTVGTATGGAGSSAIGAANIGAGTLTVDLAVGNNWGVGGSGGYAYGVYGSGAAGQTTTVRRTQSGPYGAPAIGGAVLMVADASNSAQFRTAYGGATLTLTDPSASADWPAEADVRAGVGYDLGDKTGTAHIPAAGQVALGVPVDATTGTAVLTAAAVAAGVWDAARASYDGAGTFGATAEWAGSVDEAGIATAVRTELATELARIDAAVSSRNAVAPLDAAGTRSAVGLTSANLDDQLAALPTAGENRDAVIAGLQAEDPPIPANVTYQNGEANTAPTVLAAILEDTGTTLPGLLAATIANSQDVTTAGSITRRRGNSWSISLTLGALTGYTSLWFTVKRSYDDADSAALVQIKLNASGLSDGLLYVNGAAPTSAALGSITVSDATTGAIIVALDETITDDLTPDAYYYDCQVLISGNVTTPETGTLTVTADVTRSVA